MTVPPGLDERAVEDKLRRILGPLDRHLDRGNTLVAATLIAVVPATFLVLWMPGLYDRYRSLGAAVGAFGLVIALGLIWDLLASRLALWRFEAAFPADGAEREVALRILNEMQTPTQAEDRLRELIARRTGRRVRRVPPPLPPADAVPAIDPVRPERVARAEATPPRPGYYDYIPLEPKKGEDRPPVGEG